MVDVDRELFVESSDAGTVKVGAFDNKDRIVGLVDPFNIANIVSTGKASIRERNVAANDDLYRFSERTQQPTKAQRRSNTISIGFDVSGYSKILLVFN